jgi:hypothetical protein
VTDEVLRYGLRQDTVKRAYASVSSINAFINVGTEGAGSLTARNGATVNITGSTGFGFLGVGRNENANGELNIESGAQMSRRGQAIAAPSWQKAPAASAP